jgi:tRNA dimethylallyltransferase
MKNIVIIAGPTASGKSLLGIEVSKRLNGEIISADSMQIYKHMDIGTAKIKREEMQGIPHHLIDILYPHEEFSVAMFRNMAGGLIDEITLRDRLPVIVGGTGLYINALTYELDFTEAAEDKEYREYLQSLADEKGNEYVHNILREANSEAAERIHPNNLKKVIRALEVYKLTGKAIDDYQSKQVSREYNIAYIGLNMDRKTLYDRINDRVDKMFDMGLVEEVKKLKEFGYNKNMTSMQAIGYKEVFDYIDGIHSLEETKDIIKQSSRRYAKRQLTWFRRDERIHWVNVDEFDSLEQIIENIISFIEGKFKLL